mgnify:CR=1 FL=1
MSQFISNLKELTKEINEFGGLYQSVGRRMETIAANVIWFAASKGDVRPLNQFFSMLRENDATAMKLAIRRLHRVVGFGDTAIEGLDAELGKAAEKAGRYFTIKKDEGFGVIAGGHKSEQAQAIVKLAEGEYFGEYLVFVKNNFDEIKTFGDEEILKAVAKVANLLEESDKRKVSVSARTREWVKGLKASAEARIAAMGAAPQEIKLIEATPVANAA